MVVRLGGIGLRGGGRSSSVEGGGRGGGVLASVGDAVADTSGSIGVGFGKRWLGEGGFGSAGELLLLRVGVWVGVWLLVLLGASSAGVLGRLGFGEGIQIVGVLV